MRIHRRTAGAIAVLLLVGAGAAANLSSAAAGPSLHFTASGDYGSTPSTRSVLAGIAALEPDLHFALGDLSYGVTGEEQTWCDFVTSQVGAGFPFELLAGNHESRGQNGNINDVSACLPNQLPGLTGTYGRQYYVDVPQGAPLVRYVMISPGIQFPDSTWSYAADTVRYEWTAAAIDGARDAGIPWVVVGMHKPCLSIGRYECDPGEDILNLLVEKRVDVVLTGHEHLYQRTKQLATGAECPALSSTQSDPLCIADSDDSLKQGAGAVFVTVGTGGRDLRDVVPTDAKAPYFAAWSGRNSEPTFGSLDVVVTSTELTARFVAVSDGAFTDAFTIARDD